MVHVTDAIPEAEAFVETLGVLVERERGFAPHPSEVQTAEVWSGEIRQRLEQRWVIGDDDNLTALVAVLGGEPSTWHCQVARTEDGPWSARLSPFLRTYADVTSPVEYVDRLVETIELPPQLPLPLHPSSLSLPEAIDYLNAVWRANVGNGKALIRISRAEAAAKLALECATADEFESRLSAFAGILGQLRVPPAKEDRKLVDLRDFLGRILKDDVATRAQAGVDVLRDIVALRVWRQHPGTDAVGSKAAQRLGIAFPSESWGATWDQIRELAVSALSAIREEIDQHSPSQ
jgi:hypothetical protein